MTVASEQPHFLAVDDDALGTGVVIYRLEVLYSVFIVYTSCSVKPISSNHACMIVVCSVAFIRSLT